MESNLIISRLETPIKMIEISFFIFLKTVEQNQKTDYIFLKKLLIITTYEVIGWEERLRNPLFFLQKTFIEMILYTRFFKQRNWIPPFHQQYIFSLFIFYYVYTWWTFFFWWSHQFMLLIHIMNHGPLPLKIYIMLTIRHFKESGIEMHFYHKTEISQEDQL